MPVQTCIANDFCIWPAVSVVGGYRVASQGLGNLSPMSWP